MMTTTAHSKIQARHLTRDAYLYIRQSSLRQVLENTESTARQYALKQRAIASCSGRRQSSHSKKKLPRSLKPLDIDSPGFDVGREPPCSGSCSGRRQSSHSKLPRS